MLVAYTAMEAESWRVFDVGDYPIMCNNYSGTEFSIESDQ